MEATGRNMRVLFVPSVREGDGIGHLNRCLELVDLFPGGAILNTDGPAGEERLRRVAVSLRWELPEGRIVSSPSGGEPWELVVIDRRTTSLGEMRSLERYGPLLGLDEGGEARRYLPYLIDTLPLPVEQGRANLVSSLFQSHPRNVRAEGASWSGRALVTYGGEDPAGLTVRMTRALIDGGHYPPGRIDVVKGPLHRWTDPPSGVTVVDTRPDLRERLWHYDIVFTAFGLTAYEAAHAGVAVVLLNPTAYHRRLSRIAGFPEIGVGSVDRRSLDKLLSDPDALLRRCTAVVAGDAPRDDVDGFECDRSTNGARAIAARVAHLDFRSAGVCPVCRKAENPAVGRFPERSFFRCTTCSTVYETSFSSHEQSYGQDYFFEAYRQQYGRTYLQDFDNIRRFSAARLDQIEKTASAVRTKTLLDVGCAFGPFLVEADGRGARVFGVDVAQEAVDYVRGTLKLPCRRVDLLDFDLAAAFGLEEVDVLTMWYVIEHFPDLGTVLKKVNTMLSMGGVFAFSTPNLAGISGRSDLNNFLQRSPLDHYAIWEPRTARAILKRFGFEVKRVRITGHHPERFPLRGADKGWRCRLLLRLSKLAGLGDTFECYAVKVSEIT